MKKNKSRILIAFLLAAVIMKKIGFRDEIVFEVLLVIIPLGILGARLYYIIFSGESLANFFNFRSGGIAIYGAVLAGALGVFIYTRFIRRCSFFAISDIVVLVLILAQSIGRWEITLTKKFTDFRPAVFISFRLR